MPARSARLECPTRMYRYDVRGALTGRQVFRRRRKSLSTEVLKVRLLIEVHTSSRHRRLKRLDLGVPLLYPYNTGIWVCRCMVRKHEAGECAESRSLRASHAGRDSWRTGPPRRVTSPRVIRIFVFVFSAAPPAFTRTPCLLLCAVTGHKTLRSPVLQVPNIYTA